MSDLYEGVVLVDGKGTINVGGAMAGAEALEEVVALQPPYTVDQLRDRLIGELGNAMATVQELVGRGHGPASSWQTKLARLHREIMGGVGRVVYGAATAKLEPVGPVVDIIEWAAALQNKIAAFVGEYLAAAQDDEANFPRERMAADWQQELSMFVPTARETAVEEVDNRPH